VIMAEQFARGVNGIDLCYETFGDPADPPLLLVMGLSAPMIWWDEPLCEQLAGRGFHVIRFDNRDSGRSTSVGGRASVPRAYLARQAPYSLADLADDTAALLDRLEITSAHVVGASLGGMVGQLLAIRRPDLVASLTSIMSTTGNRLVGWPRPAALGALLAREPRERAAYIEQLVKTFRVIGSPGYPFDEERMRARAARTFDRGINPAGVARQLAAVLATPDRTKALRSLRIPVSVIHGAEDPLIHVGAGLATARAVPGAELHVFHGMGHDLPEPLWTRFADVIAQTAALAAAPTEADR